MIYFGKILTDNINIILILFIIYMIDIMIYMLDMINKILK